MKQIYDPLNNNVNWENRTILIVEDVEPNYYLLKKSLEKTKAKIVRAGTGDEAIKICESNPDIDVVLMDIHLPDITGHQATRKIKELRKEITIIAQTAFVFSGERQKSIDAGCDDYIAKPIRSSELIYKIRKCLIDAGKEA
jgi:CheY-like chemotaxis protein